LFIFLIKIRGGDVKKTSTPFKRNIMKTAIIVGAGHRALGYAKFALDHPEALKIIGVADPIELRRKQTAKKHNFPLENCFNSAEDLAKKPKFADFIINGTMDSEHLPTTLPLLEIGYDVLLEKPFAVTEDEVWDLLRATKRLNRKVAICHVLRYAPFYALIRKKVIEGAIGEIINLQLTEHVSYHHTGIGFVRGKWRNEAQCGSGKLMSKSCHDLDLMAWMMSGNQPTRVSSSGSNLQFTPEKAPEKSGTRCLVDCPIEEDCLYSAKKHYIDHPKRWAFYVWDCLEHIENPTIEQKIESLKTDNIYGKCVWKCDNDVVDHQSVIIEFASGATGTLNMIGGCSKPSRSIHLIGTRGEIQGNLEDSRFVLRHIDPRPGCEYSEEIIDLNQDGDMTGAFGGHGGGDEKLIEDFVKIVSGETPSISSTSIEDSVAGHLMGFYAEKARKENKCLEVPGI
jgi:predicted dehydrogenase